MEIKWACGHTGTISKGKYTVIEPTQKCLVCKLIEQWEILKDPRATRSDKYQLARNVAETQGIKIKLHGKRIPMKKNLSSKSIDVVITSSNILVEYLKQQKLIDRDTIITSKIHPATIMGNRVFVTKQLPYELASLTKCVYYTTISKPECTNLTLDNIELYIGNIITYQINRVY